MIKANKCEHKVEGGVSSSFNVRIFNIDVKSSFTISYYRMEAYNNVITTSFTTVFDQESQLSGVMRRNTVHSTGSNLFLKAVPHIFLVFVSFVALLILI